MSLLIVTLLEIITQCKLTLHLTMLSNMFLGSYWRTGGRAWSRKSC